MNKISTGATPAPDSVYDICVLGLGYIGLPTASVFATKGKRVLGVDVRAEVVDRLNAGQAHFEEPDLDTLVKAAVNSRQLMAATKPAAAHAYIVAVPTPFNNEQDGRKTPDLSYVEAATRSLASVVVPGCLVILESTSPVGTTELMRDWLMDERRKQGLSAEPEDFLFAHCPERILPGQMMKELVSNDRICGGLTPKASEVARTLYSCFCSAQIFVTDARTAEMSKLTENSYRDVNIAFANELSMICDELKINVWELIELANRHPRVKILQPGPGVGGHCIAVDPWFILDAAPKAARLIRTAREVNDHKPHHVIDQIKASADRFKKPVIACLGLAFKADVDDLRESPSMDIVEDLVKENIGTVLVVEPHVRALPKRLAALQPPPQLTGLQEAFEAADIVVVLVNHREFIAFNPLELNCKVIIDTRGIWRKR